MQPEQLRSQPPVQSQPMNARFVPPAWLLFERGGALEVRDLEARAPALALSGALAAAALEGDAAPLLRLVPFRPELSDFARDLSAAAPRALTRADVLRGGGYRMLFLELGARCNERCVHCYAESHPSRAEALTLDEVLAVLDDAHALGFRVVQLTGGDPLIAPTLLPAARRAHALGFETIEIYTNGLSLDRALLDELLPLRPSFAFSFYSHDAEIHDAITRTPGSQARTARAIAMTVDAGLDVRVSLIALELNHASLDRTVELVRALGVSPDAIRVDVQRGVGRGTFAADSDTWTMPAPSGGSHRPREEIRFGGMACVGFDGLVYPCIFSRHLPLGDLRRERLRTILERRDEVVVPAHLEPASFRERLACGDCQMRAALLTSSGPCVPLRRPSPRPDPTR